MRVQCFGCKRAARSENCTLRRHKKSGIKRWFHKENIKPGCLSRFIAEDWQEVDPLLGETTDEEMKRIIG